MIEGGEIRKRNLVLRFIDRTSFFKIFLLWATLLIAFGLIYYLITISGIPGNFLINQQGNFITSIYDHIYFSFISGTTTGYGDIVPSGILLRTLAIVNVVIGFVMISVVTSKLVSMKQENLLEQIYSLTYSENINRLISGMAVFRADADHMISEFRTSHHLDRKTLFTLRISLSSLKHHMNEIKAELFIKHPIIKKTERIMFELILSRMAQVFDKIEELIDLMNRKEIAFKNPLILEEMYIITNIGEQSAEKLKKEFPIFTTKADEVLATIKNIRSHIMSFKVIDADKDIEITVSPEVVANELR